MCSKKGLGLLHTMHFYAQIFSFSGFRFIVSVPTLDAKKTPTKVSTEKKPGQRV